jgi:hypothetical protein
MENKNESRLKQKATFYFNEKCECHIIKEPKGFVNGLFLSDLKVDSDGREYFDFQDQRYKGEVIKLLMWDIFDIQDYKVKEW